MRRITWSSKKISCPAPSSVPAGTTALIISVPMRTLIPARPGKKVVRVRQREAIITERGMPAAISCSLALSLKDRRMIRPWAPGSSSTKGLLVSSAFRSGSCGTPGRVEAPADSAPRREEAMEERPASWKLTVRPSARMPRPAAAGK